MTASCTFIVPIISVGALSPNSLRRISRLPVTRSAPFACVASAYRSNKLRDLVGTVGAERRLMTGPEESREIAGQLATPLSPLVAARIALLRQSSNRYLAHALG